MTVASMESNNDYHEIYKGNLYFKAVLNKLMFWSEHYKDRGYFYETDEKLAKQIGVSQRAFKKWKKVILDKGIFETRVKRTSVKNDDGSFTIKKSTYYYSGMNKNIFAPPPKPSSASAINNTIKNYGLTGTSRPNERGTSRPNERGTSRPNERGTSRPNIYTDITTDITTDLSHAEPAPVPEVKQQRDDVYKNVIKETASALNKSLPDQIKPADYDKIIDEMKKAWVQIVGKLKPADNESRRTSFLRQALTDKFGNDIENWKAYCEKIITSKFLMGEKTGFKATLDWALKFENIDKILGGELYDFGDRTPMPRQEQIADETEALEKEIQDSSDSKNVRTVRLKLLKSMGTSKYKSWIKPCDMRDTQQADGKYYLKIQCLGSQSALISTRFSRDIEKSIDGIYGSYEIVTSPSKVFEAVPSKSTQAVDKVIETFVRKEPENNNAPKPQFRHTGSILKNLMGDSRNNLSKAASDEIYGHSVDFKQTGMGG